MALYVTRILYAMPLPRASLVPFTASRKGPVPEFLKTVISVPGTNPISVSRLTMPRLPLMDTRRTVLPCGTIASGMETVEPFAMLSAMTLP